MAALPPPNLKRFREVLAQAIDAIRKQGYDDPKAIDKWIEYLRVALDGAMPKYSVMEHMVRLRLKTEYNKLVENQGILNRHPGVSTFTLKNVSPKLRLELDRRVLAAADLIKLNRSQAIEKTIQRFQGWATSIPPGGSSVVEKGKEKKLISRTLEEMSFIERRVIVDQGHKFTANLSQILAINSGAIAAKWHSHFRQANYDYRKDHKDRDFSETGKVYLIKDSWAYKEGFVKPGKAGYLNDIDQPGEAVFCRCYCTYISSLSGIPEDMLTAKGKAQIAQRTA